ncbi:hypothetical protein A1O3_01127 [Capronia epimyces CBS 606.96]|uniref:Transcription factor Iwr1 domain-containing protein n=1 Tax=Capronia epimyces CBS 606.96 TaxID=1182542 RepID=W9YSD8_9EURO|nr:uncharacterized protein A1O3_01127 [Capronia epimyces CBS 606.96]EXJ92575.1 hypothetical protein A1O3_01127 [Capronia epimyces CBS 606.96]
MSVVPERISVKRRRSDEPVDTLFLEHGSAPDKKRRVTDFYFQRLRDEIIAPVSQRDNSPLTPQRSQPSIPGIPSVRWTSPGDEKRDYEHLKAKLKEKADNNAAPVGATNTAGEESQPAPVAGSHSAPTTPIPREGPQQARRFHLTRHLSSALSPNSSGGIRKVKTAIRPPLATFVERHGATFSHEQSPLHKVTPLDNVLDVPNDGKSELTTSDARLLGIEALEASKRTPINTFLQASKQAVRKGTSIRDHPSTWDHDSDQLADELAALAMELDPDVKGKAEDAGAPSRPVPEPEDTKMISSDHEENYVYETYIRVRHDDETPDPISMIESNNVGVLVIEDEDEDLWQKYAGSDDDTDWDEEDSNAEENPANDYPEDEVSSDDEYGYNAYSYRQYGSEDETFGGDGDDIDETDNKW